MSPNEISQQFPGQCQHKTSDVKFQRNTQFSTNQMHTIRIQSCHTIGTYDVTVVTVTLSTKSATRTLPKMSPRKRQPLSRTFHALILVQQLGRIFADELHHIFLVRHPDRPVVELHSLTAPAPLRRLCSLRPPLSPHNVVHSSHFTPPVSRPSYQYLRQTPAQSASGACHRATPVVRHRLTSDGRQCPLSLCTGERVRPQLACRPRYRPSRHTGHVAAFLCPAIT